MGCVCVHLEHPGREEACSLALPGSGVGRVCALMHTRAHTYTNQIFIDGELASFLSMGRNLPPLMQVVGASGAQEYWDLGAFSGQGALSVEAKLDDSMKRKASLPAAFPGASLLAPWPTCLQL